MSVFKWSRELKKGMNIESKGLQSILFKTFGKGMKDIYIINMKKGLTKGNIMCISIP